MVRRRIGLSMPAQVEAHAAPRAADVTKLGGPLVRIATKRVNKKNRRGATLAAIVDKESPCRTINQPLIGDKGSGRNHRESESRSEAHGHMLNGVFETV